MNYSFLAFTSSACTNLEKFTCTMCHSLMLTMITFRPSWLIHSLNETSAFLFTVSSTCFYGILVQHTDSLLSEQKVFYMVSQVIQYEEQMCVGGKKEATKVSCVYRSPFYGPVHVVKS